MEDGCADLIHQVALHDPRPGASCVRRPPCSRACRAIKACCMRPRQRPADRQPDQPVFRQPLYERTGPTCEAVLKARHYGRYVDDMVLFARRPGHSELMVCADGQFLEIPAWPPSASRTRSTQPRELRASISRASSSSRAEPICGGRVFGLQAKNQGMGTQGIAGRSGNTRKTFLKASTAISAC